MKPSLSLPSQGLSELFAAAVSLFMPARASVAFDSSAVTER